MNTKTFCLNLLITRSSRCLGEPGFDTAVCCHLPVSAGSTRLSAGRPSCRMCPLGKVSKGIQENSVFFVRF